MQHKCILNSQITMPVTEEFHEVIVACGYRLTNQEMLHLEYEANGKRLTFNMATGIKYESWWDESEEGRGSHWTTMFECRIHFALDQIAILDILNGVGAINYFALPEARQAIREALNEVRKKTVEPLSEKQLREAIAA